MASSDGRAWRPRSAALALALSSIVLVASERPAHAQSVADRQTARALMEEGDAKREARDYKGALAAYERADGIMHVPTTGLEVAKMQAQVGLLLEARETLGRVMRIPFKTGEPAPFTAARKTAEQLDEELAARVPSVQVSVVVRSATPRTAIVTVDGEPLPNALLGVPRKVNPGRHEVVARVGSAEKVADVTVLEGEATNVNLELDIAVKPDASEPATHPAPAHASDEKSRALPVRPALVFGGFTLAAVGVATGVVTGVISMAKVRDVRKLCDGNNCPPETAADIDTAKTLGNVSTVAFVLGGIGAAAGIVGLLLPNTRHAAKATGAIRGATRTAEVHPLLGPTYVGLAGRF